MTGPSPHLSWSELACKDRLRTPYPLDWRGDRALKLAAVFEAIRAACGDQPIPVLSGFRTPEYNRRIGGARASQHVEGRALDLQPPHGYTVRQFYDRIAALARDELGDIKGLGYYPASGFVHVDVRPAAELVAWNGGDARKDATA